MFVIEIPGEPFAQPRQRHRVVKLPGREPFVQNYQPADARNWKAETAWLMRQARGDLPPLQSPVRLGVIFYFPCPPSHRRKRVPVPTRWRTSKPDLDNLLKAVIDAGTQAGLWLDDAQVVVIWPCTKLTAAQDAPAHTLLAVEPLSSPVASYDLLAAQVRAWLAPVLAAPSRAVDPGRAAPPALPTAAT